MSDLPALTPGAIIEGVRLEDYSFAGSQAGNAKFDTLSLNNTDFSDTKLKNLEMIDVVMDRGLMFGSSWQGASLQRLIMTNVMASGLVLSEAALVDVTFENCKLDLANFRFSKLRNVVFKKCLMKEADFQGAHLSNVTFESCDLEQADFSGIKASVVDLRSSNLASLNGIMSLKGVTVSQPQLFDLAPTFAASIGLIVSSD